MIIRELLTKKPFARVTCDGYLQGKQVKNLHTARYPEDKPTWLVVSQADFIREFYPSGHKINSTLYYPDKIKYDEKNDKFYEEKVFRASFPLQQVITVQQLVHLCGNDIHHELTDGEVTDEAKNLFFEFQKGWLDKNLEIAFYDFAKSVKVTGDGAIVFYLKEGKVFTKNLSYMDGDTLFPHYDSITGELVAFARKYMDYDEEGKEIIEWVEVWDEKKMYRYRRDKKGLKGLALDFIEYFGLEGYVLDEEPKSHGFKECPVVYHRDNDGACWSMSQDNIDKYELAISHLCQNNMAYAFPIMVLKGEDVAIEGDMYGAVKAVTMGQDDDASFMNRPEASSAFELQLNTLLKMIFMGSFVVMPPEVKSGDLPGVAIKLIYSPSMDKAMVDAKEFDKAIDKMQKLFLYGYGTEIGKHSKFMGLRIFSWADPYVHQNAAELINNLVQSVNSSILSKETASELTGYGKNNEFDKIMREYKEQQSADLLYQLKSQGQSSGGEE